MRQRVFKINIYLVFFVAIIGCAKSPVPEITDLEVIAPPSFDGSQQKTFTTTGVTYLLEGSCDVRSIGIEYSLDGSSYNVLGSGCSKSGRFSIEVKVRGTVKVYVRAITRSTVTVAAIATIQALSAPSSTTLHMVAASSSKEFTAGATAMFTLGPIFAGNQMNGPTATVFTYMPGMTYGSR